MKTIYACDFCGRDALHDGAFAEFNGKTCFGHPECIDMNYEGGRGVFSLMALNAVIAVVVIALWWWL